MAGPATRTGLPVLPWWMVIVSVLAMIGAIALALLLIPQLSLNAAINGGRIAVASFLGTQIALRIYGRYRRRHDRG